MMEYIPMQSFPALRESQYPYIDKTDLVYKLSRERGVVFLSRPRRFGKSLTLTTLQSYFESDRAAFQGTAMAHLESKWEHHEVLLIDFNLIEKDKPGELEARLETVLSDYEEIYGITELRPTYAARFERLIKAARERSGRGVVVLIDEYDKPLLSLMGNREEYDKVCRQLKAFYTVLKTCNRQLRFAMLTGVSRFSGVSVFSDLNNLMDISFMPEYSTLCGLTEGEVLGHFRPEIQRIADKKHLGFDECYAQLRAKYDGYLFAWEGERVYNPYSLLICLRRGKMLSSWLTTGTPTFMIDAVRDNRLSLLSDLSKPVSEEELSNAYEYDGNPVPLLYQTGYLTFDHCDALTGGYVMRFPNGEVKQGFLQLAGGRFLSPGGDKAQHFAFVLNCDFIHAVYEGRCADFMALLQDTFREHPYVLKNSKSIERDFQNCFFLIFTLMGFDVQVEQATAHGRIDVTVMTKDYLYIMELKLDTPAREALAQIKDNDYPGRFARDPRKLFLVGVSFGSTSKEIDEYVIEVRD